MSGAFMYAHDFGIESAKDYPYTAWDQNCVADSKLVVLKTTGGSQVEANSAQALKAAIVEGPVSVGIEADSFAFQFYKSGIINKDCGEDIDHGVVAIGYGVDASGIAYYIVRNSWGHSWGIDGYVNIAIEEGAGVCGIQKEPVIPLF